MLVTHAQSPFSPIVLETLKPLRPSEIIVKVAKKCFKELAVSATITAFVAIFIPVPMGAAILIAALALQFIVSFSFHSLGAWAAHRLAKGGPQSLHHLVTACEWWTGENFAFFTSQNVHMLIHEMGHAAATLCVYKSPRPRVEIMPFEGGRTSYYKLPVNWIGKKIGPVATTIFIASSGPALTLLVSSILLVVGLAIRAKHSQASKHLICWSAYDFLNHARYAYSTLGTDPSNIAHDFARLSIVGINPIVATISILAIPLLITTAVLYYQSRHPRQPLPVIEPVISLV
jgi:hypothetical protein